jgi:hypothetical protein
LFVRQNSAVPPEEQHKVYFAPHDKAWTQSVRLKWLNVLLGNLKTPLSGTHRGFKFAEYAWRYLSEVHCRFNRREEGAPWCCG